MPRLRGGTGGPPHPYRANREKAVRRVLREETPPCPVPGEELAAHFAPPECPPVVWDDRPHTVPDMTPAGPSPHSPADRPVPRRRGVAPAAPRLQHGPWN